VIDLGVHRLDLVLWLLGEPRVESVAAVTHDRLASVLRRPLRLRHKVDVEDFGGGLLRLEGGRSVVFEVSWAENSGRREVMVTRVLGEKGGAVQRNIDHTYRYQAELYADRRGRLVEVESKAFAQKALVPAREFARGVAAGRIDGPDAQTGLRLQLVLEAIYRSAADGREVALKELGP
jgi:predicted dehydrogenase